MEFLFSRSDKRPFIFWRCVDNRTETKKIQKIPKPQKKKKNQPHQPVLGVEVYLTDYLFFLKLDGVGPIDNRPSTD